MRGQGIKHRAARLAAASLVAAVGFGSIGVAPASAALPPAQNTTSFCVNTPAGFGGFTDISTTIHRRPIECMAFATVAAGKAPGRFAPGDPVTRGQMASFIARAIDIANELEEVELPSLPSSPPDRFSDDNTDVHEANINRLAAANIVSGTSAGSFSPAAPVTRAQMATFINNAQRFLSGGSAVFSSSEDYFVDDNASPHEANINGIASVGITQGVDRIHYGPSANVERANMATFIARYLAVLHAAGAIEELGAEEPGPPPPPPPPPSNATIAVTPTTPERLTTAVEPSDADDRTYTATGLQNRLYRVSLFQASTVTVDPGPIYTFTEDGTSNIASEGTTNARITKVNGIAVTPAASSVGAITPVNGQITFTVDADGFTRVYPVIFTDEGGTGTNTRLNLNDQNRPLEPFGVGGLLETLPENASSGTLGTDASVVFTDESVNLFVANVQPSQRTFRYDDNDRFYNNTVTVANELTLAEFEALLNVGDRLDANTAYNANPTLSSTFILENVSPPPPTPSVASVGERTAVITISDLLPGATANVYLGPDGAGFAGTTKHASSSVDGNPGEPGFQVNLSGLTPATSYEYYVTQTLDGEESQPLFVNPGAGTTLVTTAEVPPHATAVTVNGGRAGTTTNLVNVDFNEAVTPIPGAGNKLTVTCTRLEPSPIPLLPPTTVTTFTGTSTGVTQVDPNTVQYTLNGNIPNDGSTCRANLGAAAVRDSANQSNAAQTNLPVG